MECYNFRKYLNAFSDGETGRGLAGEIENHLAGCPGCNRAFQQASGLRNLLLPATPVPLPEGFADTVMRRVRRHSLPVPEPVPLVAWWHELTFPLRAASAVSFLLIICAGAFMGGNLTRERQPSSGLSAASAGAVVLSMMQPLNETGAESLAGAYLTLTTDQ